MADGVVHELHIFMMATLEKVDAEGKTAKLIEILCQCRTRSIADAADH